MILQKTITLQAPQRGPYLITEQIQESFSSWPEEGLLFVFLQHTSAGLSINENCDPKVQEDLETSFNRLAPDDNSLYTHTLEGCDDMPAHVKSSLTGVSLQIPIVKGKLSLGKWQGIFLWEFRTRPTPRNIVLTCLS